MSKAVVFLFLLPFLGACTQLPKVDNLTCSRLHYGYTRGGITVTCRGTVKILRTQGYDGGVALATIQDDPECRACQKDWNSNPLLVKHLGEW